jgi:phospholipase/carboxylesterase
MNLDHRHLDPAQPSDQPPLLILLHGYGANMDDLVSLGPMLDPRLRVVAAQAPVDLGRYGMPGGHAWFNLMMTPEGLDFDRAEAETATDAAAEFVRRAREQWPSDPARTYVLGFSQGAMMAHAMLLRNTAPLAGIMACSGRKIEALFDEHVDREHLRDVPVFVSHGRQDDVIPVSSGRAIRDWYEATPAKLSYHEYDMGHGIGPECLADVQAWLHACLAAPSPVAG